jgi:hypothetical protein
MTVDSMDLITLRGTVLPLNQRRRDALAHYAKLAAEDAGIPAQTWCRKVWGLKDYEAKDLLKSNSSEAVWERIVQRRHPEHGGFRLILTVYGAVLGEQFEDFIEKERKTHAERERRLSALGRDVRLSLASRRTGPGAGTADAGRSSPERRSYRD